MNKIASGLGDKIRDFRCARFKLYDKAARDVLAAAAEYIKDKDCGLEDMAHFAVMDCAHTILKDAYDMTLDDKEYHQTLEDTVRAIYMHMFRMVNREHDMAVFRFVAPDAAGVWNKEFVYGRDDFLHARLRYVECSAA